MVLNNTDETFLINRKLYLPGEEIPDELAKKQGIYDRLLEDPELSDIPKVPLIRQGQARIGQPAVIMGENQSEITEKQQVEAKQQEEQQEQPSGEGIPTQRISKKKGG